MQITSAILLCVAAVASVVGVPYVDAVEGGPVVRAPVYSKRLTSDMVAAQSEQHARLARRDDTPNNAIYNDHGVMNLVQVNIGTPAQPFKLVLDTTSADTWVSVGACADNCQGTVFYESQSSTLKDLKQNFTISNNVNRINGRYVTDTMEISGLKIQNQQFALVDNAASLATLGNPQGGSNRPTKGLYASAPVRGVFGMSFKSLSSANQQGQNAYEPFVFSLVSQKVIQDPVVSLYMGTSNTIGWIGEITLGGIDASKYTGSVNYLPVVADQGVYSVWKTYGQGITVKDGITTPQVTVELGSIVIFTSSAPFTYLPTDDANKIVASVAGVGGYNLDQALGAYIVNCNLANSKATMEIQLAPSASYTDNPTVLRAPVSGLVLPLDADSLAEATKCVFAVSPTGSGSPNAPKSYIIGSSFIRNYYVVFDIGQNRIGFATAVPNADIHTQTPQTSSSSPGQSGSGKSAASSLQRPLFLVTLASSVAGLAMSLAA